jgi:hypothetical protein
MDNLILVRLDAHFNYLVGKIHDEDKRNEFIRSMFMLRNDETPREDRYGGAEMALDIYCEIVQIHKERFEEGRSGDAYFEKI